MKYLHIGQSDGDVSLTVTDTSDPNEDEDTAYYTLQGIDYLKENNDPDYWKEDTVVVLKLADDQLDPQEIETAKERKRREGLEEALRLAQVVRNRAQEQIDGYKDALAQLS